MPNWILKLQIQIKFISFQFAWPILIKNNKIEFRELAWNFIPMTILKELIFQFSYNTLFLKNEFTNLWFILIETWQNVDNVNYKPNKHLRIIRILFSHNLYSLINHHFYSVDSQSGKSGSLLGNTSYIFGNRTNYTEFLRLNILRRSWFSSWQSSNAFRSLTFSWTRESCLLIVSINAW